MKWFEYTLSGKDGVDLLQRVSASDFRLIEVSTRLVYSDGLILNPQGKIVAYFKYQMIDALSVSILLPTSRDDLARKSFLEVLERYTFAEKYEFKFIQEREIEVNEHERIQKIEPRIDFEFKTDEKTSPLDINLSAAIADQKGCYPGQEVIEKIISIGQAPKKLCLLEISGNPVQGEAILDSQNDSEVGILTSFTTGPSLGLGILRKTHAKISQELKTKSGCRILVKQ